MEEVMFVMGDNQTEMEYEQGRLERTICLAKKQLEEARELNEENRLAIIAAKQDLRENTVHSIGNLWNGEDFEALAELSQYANPITEKIEDYESIAGRIVQLENLIRSPYFARIDFRFDDEDEAQPIYIGRISLKKDKRSEPYIYDWRSPIASVFYRFVLGAAYYDAPAGRIAGEVSLKRQYEINQSVLEYFFDAEVQIVDEFLRKLLSRNTSSQMKAIVETIQREQDIVIRDMESDLMMVQGVAGSGKTSIALHRAAYLMYQGLSARLAAENILIISPNPVFEQYVSNVLPELGEENVASVIFEDLAAKIIGSGRVQSKNKFLENLIAGAEYREIIKSSIEFKTSRPFIRLLNRFIDDIPETLIAFEDVCYDGACVMTKAELKEKVMSGRNETPLGTRLKLIREYALDRICETAKRRFRRLEKDAIRTETLKFMEFDIGAAYQNLVNDSAYFARLAEGLELPACLGDIITYTKENLASMTVYYDDAAVLAYLHLNINGVNEYKNIRQVVIDEAQDYYPLHFEIFRRLFPAAKFTVLGDINQTLEKQEDLTLYETIRQIFGRKKSSLVTMNKSFRCTNQILNYSSKFLDQSLQVESFNRDGDEPQLFALPDRTGFEHRLIAEVRACQAAEYRSIGLICKTQRGARHLYDSLKGQMEVQLIDSEHTADLHGVFIIPVYMSKGLEFDAVLICDADRDNYHSDDDKKLLYISCTRALHRLNLFCQGTPSPLL